MNTDREILQHCLNIISRLAPQSVESHLLTLLKLLPFVVHSKLPDIGVDAETPSPNNAIVLDLSQELLNLVDTPLKVLIDEESSKKEEFLISEFNRDGDAYRSPFTDRYILPRSQTSLSATSASSDDAFHPAGILRTLEISLNNAVSIYREMYFEGGISSVYCWDIEEAESVRLKSILEHFACAILLKKVVREGEAKFRGGWDSIHIFEVKKGKGDTQYKYKVTSTVMLNLMVTNGPVDVLNVGGSVTRENTFEHSVTATKEEVLMREHVSHIGRCLEEMEGRLRSFVQEIYFSKTYQAISSLHVDNSSEKARQYQEKEIARAATQA